MTVSTLDLVFLTPDISPPRVNSGLWNSAANPRTVSSFNLEMKYTQFLSFLEVDGQLMVGRMR
jgi:hypothetical protein